MYSDPFDYSEYRNTGSWILLLLAVAGLAARFVLLSRSWGTDDVDLWWRFAEAIRVHGLFEMYPREAAFHYPLLTGLLLHGAHHLSELSGLSFPTLLRLPGILTDCVLTILLYRLLIPYGFRVASWGAAAYGSSIVAMLISGYHGAIEPLYVFLTFFAFICLEARGRPGVAGFLLGIACNFKLLPLLFFPALLTGCRSLRESLSLALGAAIGLIPVFYGAWELGPLFLNQVLFFDPGRSDWNIERALTPIIALWPQLVEWKEWFLAIHESLGRSILVVCLTGFALREMVRPSRTPIHVAAISFCLFLLLAPGFMVEYTLLGAAFFAATLPTLALGFGAIAGAWAASTYLHFNISTEVWRSVHSGQVAWITVALGAATWCYTAFLLYKLLRIEELYHETKQPFFGDDEFM